MNGFVPIRDPLNWLHLAPASPGCWLDHRRSPPRRPHGQTRASAAGPSSRPAAPLSLWAQRRPGSRARPAATPSPRPSPCSFTPCLPYTPFAYPTPNPWHSTPGLSVRTVTAIDEAERLPSAARDRSTQGRRKSSKAQNSNIHVAHPILA